MEKRFLAIKPAVLLSILSDSWKTDNNRPKVPGFVALLPFKSMKYCQNTLFRAKLTIQFLIQVNQYKRPPVQESPSCPVFWPTGGLGTVYFNPKSPPVT